MAVVVAPPRNVTIHIEINQDAHKLRLFEENRYNLIGV